TLLSISAAAALSCDPAASYRYAFTPHVAATCAIPRPIVPLPTTTIVSTAMELPLLADNLRDGPIISPPLPQRHPPRHPRPTRPRFGDPLAAPYHPNRRFACPTFARTPSPASASSSRPPAPSAPSRRPNRQRPSPTSTPPVPSARATNEKPHPNFSPSASTR